MKILWLTWKDGDNPAAGGAEVVNEELAKRLAQAGHKVRFITAGYKKSTAFEKRDGYQIHRVGGRWTVYWQTYRLYRKEFQGWADIVIDEINTVPFFAKWYVKESNILFIHQLCRQIWFYQLFFPLSLIGYLLEPLYLRFLNDRQVVTVSQSTKKDLLHHGYSNDRIHIISEGIKTTPIENLNAVKKYEMPTMLSLGSVRPMKRTHHIIQAFEYAKKRLPDLQLIVAGNLEGRYGHRTQKMVKDSRYKKDIRILGTVSKERKKELMQKSHLIAVTSVKEGWGLIVTEAASQGTPAVVYNVDGLRDSVRNEETGLVCAKNTPQELSSQTVRLLTDAELYERMRRSSWQWSQEINFDQAFQDFIHIPALQ